MLNRIDAGRGCVVAVMDYQTFAETEHRNVSKSLTRVRQTVSGYRYDT
jgi:hypothetical protein